MEISRIHELAERKSFSYSLFRKIAPKSAHLFGHRRREDKPFGVYHRRSHFRTQSKQPGGPTMVMAADTLLLPS